ncbi:MAG: hypothetical protein IPK00_10580 [Deltaproteobacteria bacterium]|nr:hypothetical protein [Deltaproteobacteria bacterium]
MIGPRSFLEYARYRYLKVSLVLLLASMAIYLVEDPPGGRSGSSWTGYGLGTLAALMIVWLMWLGLRKRSYRDVGAPLQGWTSAHVYLGTSLLLLVPLHCAFEFGVNVHTLAYALMCGVIATGIVGVGVYALVPTSITRNRNNTTLDALLERIAEIDADCRVAAENLPDLHAKAVITSIEETRIGGSLTAQLAGRDPACGTTRALRSLRGSEIDLQGDARLQELKLIELVARKELLVNQIRRDVRLKGLLDLWLVLHVPLAFATVAALLVHVFVVFWYH